MRNKNKIIISLTSFPARINSVHKVIKSLLAQKKHFDKIILYLAIPQFPDKSLPRNLASLTDDSVFEIRWTDTDIGSYKKLIPALLDFPNDIIITVDDDVIYPKNLIKALLKTHHKNPMDICAHRIRTINIKENMVLPYNTWKLSEKRKWWAPKMRTGYKNFFCGVGGVLYPAHSLAPDVFNESQFKNLCAHQDDVWFWAMAVKNNRKIALTRFGFDTQKFIIKNVQKSGLWRLVNDKKQSPNNTAIDNLCRVYPEIAKKILY